MYPPRDTSKAATKDGYFGWLYGEPHFWRLDEWIGSPPPDDPSWDEDGHTHFGCNPRECFFGHPRCPIRPSPSKAGKLSAATRRAVLRRDGYRCVLCGATPELGATLEVDHIHPRARGGVNRKSNLRTLCVPCNRGKGTKLDDED